MGALALPSPNVRPQCFKIIFQQFHDELRVAGAAPPIALDAADQHFAVVIDLGEWAVAVHTGG